MPRRFLILHGWQNRRPRRHWQHWLARRLIRRGYEVDYPALPAPDEPVLKDWLGVIRDHLVPRGDAERVVICHSLACAAWMHLAGQGDINLPVGRLLFVAPPSPGFLAATPELSEFQLSPAMHHMVAGTTMAVRPRLVCASGDPYCPPGADTVYPDVFDVDRVPGAGHFDRMAGYGSWPSLLAWCEHPEVRLTRRPTLGEQLLRAVLPSAGSRR